MKRRELLAGSSAIVLARPARAARASAAAEKTVRVALNIAESGFDPPRIGDQSSIRIVSHIFESPLAYDLLARPAVLVPLTAAARPEVSADFRRYVFTLQRGILFADDPAFGGRPRELVAADYVFSIKRYYDPAIRTENLYLFENAKILGLSELRKQALKGKTPFPYDLEVSGLRALDRYRFEVRLADPAPRLAHLFASYTVGAVAREVVEKYSADPMAHPVGTGPFMLAQWRRASRTVLVRNPRFREQVFSTVSAGAEPKLQEAAVRLAGARAPLVDRIEIDIVEEAQPRWLAFLRGEHDVLTLPPDFGQLAMPGGSLAPFLQRQGVAVERSVAPTTQHTFFNFDDPLVGGYTPAQVALRRAVALAFDSSEEIRLVLKDQAIPAQSMIPPHCYGHEPLLKSEMSSTSPARAQALLDMHGYARRGDGWRTRPDGGPLVLRIAFTPDRRARASSELWHKRLQAVGLRVQFEVAPFGELIKRSLAGQLMMWGFGWGAGEPDAELYLGLAYGPNSDQSNDARFKLPTYDRLYERQRVLPDGPERLALIGQMTRLMLAYVPYLPHSHTITNEMRHAHVHGPLSHPFSGDRWRWMDVGARAGLPAA